MNYVVEQNKIIIYDLTQFNIEQILNCGQIFRYIIVGDCALVVAGDKCAFVKTFKDRVEIQTENVEYFKIFFDLNTDYEKIKQTLKKDSFLAPSLKFGYGIRLLKQELFEMIVSFIISANNNIKRIKNSLNFIAKRFGNKTKLNLKIDYSVFGLNNIVEKNKNAYFYYSFPTLNQLKNATVTDFKEAGLGYRAEQLYFTLQFLNDEILLNFNNLTTEEKFKFLISLKGVGTKVANCIMLFTKNNMKSFPVDTWINKVYNKLTNTNSTNREEISKKLTLKYKDLSGYAQQYFFYYFRENNIN